MKHYRMFLVYEGDKRWSLISETGDHDIGHRFTMLDGDNLHEAFADGKQTKVIHPGAELVWVEDEPAWTQGRVAAQVKNQALEGLDSQDLQLIRGMAADFLDNLAQATAGQDLPPGIERDNADVIKRAEAIKAQCEKRLGL
ncbi:hypothetical protein [Actinomadura atramentaria]|uniref:hypothetical protein n=1 Tax=Actinomadura atramentaria TaxID=1990 RepID=UPI00036BD35E|nr:hypothetical protein [Actinomadura atramentaria]